MQKNAVQCRYIRSRIFSFSTLKNIFSLDILNKRLCKIKDWHFMNKWFRKIIEFFGLFYLNTVFLKCEIFMTVSRLWRPFHTKHLFRSIRIFHTKTNDKKKCFRIFLSVIESGQPIYLIADLSTLLIAFHFK